MTPGNTGLTLFTDADDLDGQRLRWLVAEKGIETLRHVPVSAGQTNEDLLVFNARHDLPTLVERSLVVAGIDIVAEYLDARYPYPAMMASDPAGRARMRMILRTLQLDLEVPLLASRRRAKDVDAALHLFDDLLGRRKYMVGGSITLVDIYLLPLLWRLGHHGHRWPKVPALHDYALRLSQRPAFRACLNRREATMSLEAPA